MRLTVSLSAWVRLDPAGTCESGGEMYVGAGLSGSGDVSGADVAIVSVDDDEEEADTEGLVFADGDESAAGSDWESGVWSRERT